VDRSLWLLLRLRARAWARLWARNLRTLKGVLLALVGALLILPMLGWALFFPRVQTAAQLGAIRHYGPLGLLAYCVLNVLLSSGDRTVYYSPAEVNFLFCGPYRPRQLLLYKVAVGAGAGLVTSLIMACALSPNSAGFVSSYVALFLTLMLIYLFSMSVGLAVSTFGALAFSRGRRLLMVGVGLVVVAAVAPLGREALTLPPAELVDRAVRSPTVTAVTAPFRPFVMAYASERVWPDLLGWSALAALVDLAMLGLVLTLNTQFLEASAAASAKVYDRLRRARRGEVVSHDSAARVAVPMLPWWGGVGPNLWRQLTTAARSPSRVAAMLLLYVIPVGTILAFAGGDPSGRSVLGPAVTVFLGITLFASSAVGYDFRPDLHRMEDLKTLPIRPTRLVLGQLLTPVLILAAGQWLSLALIARFAAADPEVLVAVAALVLPGNLVLVAVENLYFLWYPYRSVGINSFDFQAMGRQLLLLTAKLATAGLAAAVAAGFAAGAYYLTGRSFLPALAVAWVAAVGCGLGLIPLVALAFDRFDVAHERTE
jgi:hypothetical protein